MLDFNTRLNSRESELKANQTAAINRWKPYIDLVEQHYASEGKELAEYSKANIAQCCENVFDMVLARKNSGLISEATTSDAIAFARQMLPTIPALLPSLVSENVAVVQAIDRPQAQIYYMDIKAATSKGSVTAGDRLIDAQTGHASSTGARRYASEFVDSEQVGAIGNTACAGTLARKPLREGTLVITDGTETFTDNGSGVLVTDASGGSNGTINYTTGVYSATFLVAPSVQPSASYRFNPELDTAGIGGVDIEVRSSNVDSIVFPIKLNYTVFAAMNLQKIHGMVLADEGMKFATQEIRFAIDQVVLDYAKQAATSTGAATSPGNFDASVGAGQEWIWRINEIKKYFSKASANIFAKTLRAQGNVIVAGINVCALIEGLAEYKPAAGIGTKPPAGPYVHGTLGNRMVICNPFFDANEYVMLFRGDNYMFAGLVYAPYVPLYSTDPVTLADLTVQRGFYSQAAVKRINDGMFTRGTISNF